MVITARMHDGAFYISQHGGNHRGQDQDDHQESRQTVLAKIRKVLFLLAGLQFIGAVFFQAGRSLLGCESPLRSSSDPGTALPGSFAKWVDLVSSSLFLSRQDAKRRDFCVNASCIDTKVSPFQPGAEPKPVLTPVGTHETLCQLLPFGTGGNILHFPPNVKWYQKNYRFLKICGGNRRGPGMPPLRHAPVL